MQSAALVFYVASLGRRVKSGAFTLGVWLWLGSFCRFGAVVTNCPNDSYRSSRVVWDCAGASFSSLVVLSAFEKSTEVIEIPSGTVGLQTTAILPNGVELEVYDEAAGTSVVKWTGGLISAGGPTGTYQGMSIRVDKGRYGNLHSDQFKEEFIFNGTLRNSLKLLLSSSSDQPSTTTVDWDYDSITPCPSEPLGCEFYSSSAASTEVNAWSCWARGRFSSDTVAWNECVDHKGETAAGVPWIRWQDVWATWPARASNRSWQYAFFYLDSDKDMHISLAEFKLGYALCVPHPAAVTDWQNAWTGTFWDSRVGERRITSQTQGNTTKGTLTFMWDGGPMHDGLSAAGRRLQLVRYGVGSYNENTADVNFDLGQRWLGKLANDGKAIQWTPLVGQQQAAPGPHIVWPRALAQANLGIDRPVVNNNIFSGSWLPRFDFTSCLLALVAVSICLVPFFFFCCPCLQDNRSNKRNYKVLPTDDLTDDEMFLSTKKNRNKVSGDISSRSSKMKEQKVNTYIPQTPSLATSDLRTYMHDAHSKASVRVFPPAVAAPTAAAMVPTATAIASPGYLCRGQTAWNTRNQVNSYMPNLLPQYKDGLGQFMPRSPCARDSRSFSGLVSPPCVQASYQHGPRRMLPGQDRRPADTLASSMTTQASGAYLAYPNSVRTPPPRTRDISSPYSEQVAVPVEVCFPRESRDDASDSLLPGPINLSETIDTNAGQTPEPEMDTGPLGPLAQNTDAKKGWTDGDWDEWAKFMATSNPMVGFSVDQWRQIGSMDQ